MEENAPGGLVCVTNGPGQTATRKLIAIKKCEPAAWEGHVALLWSADKVKVYTAPSNGVEVTSATIFANANLPTNLWVEGTAPNAATGDVVFRLNPVEVTCPQASTGCDWAVMTGVGAWLSLPPVVGVNDLVPNCGDPAGYDKEFVATAAEYEADDDLLPPGDWGVAPRDESLGEIIVTGDQRIRVLTTEGGNLVEDPSFSPTDTAAELKLEGVDFSLTPGDAKAKLTYSICTVTATTTVVQVQLDKFCYNRADPFPEVEITSVEGLTPGAQATVKYQVLDDMLDSGLPETTDTFAVEDAFGTYEYKTPPYANRIGNAGRDAIRYTVYDNNGTKTIRWSHADPDRKALVVLPTLARMDIEIKDALAATPEEARNPSRLSLTPAFAGEIGIEGSHPAYTIDEVKVLAKPPSPAYTNEVCAQVGNETILQTLHGVARDSAVVLEISGPRVVGVNDRFAVDEDGEDPGDDASKDKDIADSDFIELTLVGVPGCIASGTVAWKVTEGVDRISLVSAPEAGQIGATVTFAFENGPPEGDMLRIFIEGREASEATDDVTVTVQIRVGDSDENPRAFRGQTLEAEFLLTVTDLRWTGWKADNEENKTPARTDLLACDLDLRPAVRIEEPPGGHLFTQGASLVVSGSVRSMTDVVTDIRVNGESVSLSDIRFLDQPLAGLTSVGTLTDRPPPYVATFTHTLSQFEAGELRVEARNGVSTRPGYATLGVAYAAATGTVSTVLVASPAYDEPEMVEFFDAQSGWKFLYKTEVDHCGAGAGVVDVQGIETNGAQPLSGLFRLRLPAVLVVAPPTVCD